MADDNNDWRMKGFVQGGGGAYNQTLAVNTPSARANFNAQFGQNPTIPTVSAAERSTGSPSGTDWNATFNSPANIGSPRSPSGTDWSKTFGRTAGALAGNTTPPPSPGDIDNT